MKRYALISVSDKSGVSELAVAISDLGYGILATGKTSAILKNKGIPVIEISEYTGSREIFDGRVKTLHPKVFGGILYRRGNGKDAVEAAEVGIDSIDIVCVNLYPFVKTVENPNSSFEEIIENIDIGGPSLIRAAAKNFASVSVLTDPKQYPGFIEELSKGQISDETRKKLALAAFAHTSLYDTYIANYLEKTFKLEPSHIRVNYPVEMHLRYGENPHQNAAVFGNFNSYFEVFHGKALSYNNILDLVSAVELVEDLGGSACAIIKHNNPAGAAIGSTSYDSYVRALKCDPVSAFGGIVAFNSEVDEETAEKLNEIFLEIVCAPSFTEKAVQILQKKKDRRLLKQLKSVLSESTTYRSIPGGLISQNADRASLSEKDIKSVTDIKPTQDQLEDLYFAWKVAKHTKSNAIVFVKDKTTLGVGAGQMSRIDSAKIAAMKAEEHGHDLTGSVAASDAFFPFADGLLKIIEFGAIAVIQPGGSVRDQEVIDAANNNKTAMVFTGIRHFKH